MIMIMRIKRMLVIIYKVIINQRSPLIMEKRVIVVNMQTSDVGITKSALMLLFSYLFSFYYYYYLRTPLKSAYNIFLMTNNYAVNN